MSGIHRVFVYGTLRRHASNTHRMLEAQYLCDGKVAAKLYRVDWYPGLVVNDEGSLVSGEIFELETEALHRLDEYEGAEYRRIHVLTHDPGDPQMKVWIYEYIGETANLQAIASGNWLEAD